METRRTVRPVVAVVLAAFVCPACSFTWGGVRATREVRRDVPWAGFERLAVQVRNGSLEVRSTGGGDSVRIHGTLSVRGGTRAEAEERLARVALETGAHTERSDTFYVTVSHPDEPWARTIATSLVIEVPRPCPAEIRTSNGAIRAAGLEGEVVAATSNGAVEVRDVAGSLRISTSNGHVTAQGVSGGLRVESSNGTIEAGDVSGECVLVTSNGAIRASGLSPGAAGRIEARTSNGSVHVGLPAGLPADLDLSTSNGRVRTGIDEARLAVESRSKRALRGAANGGGCPVVVRSSNGTVTVEFR